MAKSNGLNFNLPSVDDLFSTEEERAEARLEKVVNLSPTEISDFPNHPFKVRMDAAMQAVSYTHLDVYKRQDYDVADAGIFY